MTPKNCPDCGSEAMLVGRAETQTRRMIFPHYCGDCGVVLSTMQATKSEVELFRLLHGEPRRVFTNTEKKMIEGKEYLPSRTAGQCCEVCASDEDVHEHHWAPVHLFGVEANKWPTSFLCQPCHAKWHRMVTPNMSRKGGPMPDILVTDHAVLRFQQRVRPCTDSEARDALSTPAVHAAALFGAQFVRLHTGHRIALKGHVVMTVLPPEHFKRQVFRQGLPRFSTQSNFKGQRHA